MKTANLLATYQTKEQLIAATQKLGADADVYTSYDLEELSSIEEREPIDFAAIGFIAAIIGGALGYFMLYYLSVKDLPLNIGGRPVHTALAFIPPTFECAVFAAGVSMVIAFFLSTKLPELHHPLFDSPRFLLSRNEPYFIVVSEAKAAELAETRPMTIERVACD